MIALKPRSSFFIRKQLECCLLTLKIQINDYYQARSIEEMASLHSEFLVKLGIGLRSGSNSLSLSLAGERVCEMKKPRLLFWVLIATSQIQQSAHAAGHLRAVRAHEADLLGGNGEELKHAHIWASKYVGTRSCVGYPERFPGTDYGYYGTG